MISTHPRADLLLRSFEGPKIMPYAITTPSSDGRTVDMDFEPPITSDHLRQLVGTFAARIGLSLAPKPVPGVRNGKRARRLSWMTFISKIVARFRPRREPEVVVHDPEASEPRNLDDTFFDERAQERVGTAIANSTRKV
jgi:hypothetical protein